MPWRLEVGGCSFDVLHGETGVHATDTGNRHDAAAEEGLVRGEVGDGHPYEVVGLAEETAELDDLTGSSQCGLELFDRGCVLGYEVQSEKALGLPWWVAPALDCRRSPALLNCCLSA
jgi:hypothetical protein